MNKHAYAALFLTLLFGNLILGFCAGTSFGTFRTQHEAIRAGVGEWVLEQDGTKHFAWKEVGK